MTPDSREISFAWELGGNTGHVVTLHPIALALKERGFRVRFLQRDPGAGTDLERAAEIPREGAPVWVGPPVHENPLNFGEILQNFGYAQVASLRPLVEAWRERLRNSRMVVASVAPAAHLAARTLGIPSLEVSQGFHVPPAVFPAPPLRDWEAAPRARLERADQLILNTVNQVLEEHRAAPLETLGDLFTARSALLTYPELDIYPERGPAEYYGIPHSAEGSALPGWPSGEGPRILAYLYGYYDRLGAVADSLASSGARVLAFARGADAAVKSRHRGGPVHFSDEPMAFSRLLPSCDAVFCHASHQTTAQALLAGKPLLMAPTQLEQFIIMRRVVRQGGGLGLASEVADPDVGAAVRELLGNPKYAENAQQFAARYAAHGRDAALETLTDRIERTVREAPAA
jgi:UDP:flavonoid glycosyltransferase YjiC (YdhE family)